MTIEAFNAADYCAACGRDYPDSWQADHCPCPENAAQRAAWRKRNAKAKRAESVSGMASALIEAIHQKHRHLKGIERGTTTLTDLGCMLALQPDSAVVRAAYDRLDGQLKRWQEFAS